MLTMTAQLKINGSWRACSQHISGKNLKCCKEMKLLLCTHCIHRYPTKSWVEFLHLPMPFLGPGRNLCRHLIFLYHLPALSQNKKKQELLTFAKILAVSLIDTLHAFLPGRWVQGHFTAWTLISTGNLDISFTRTSQHLITQSQNLKEKGQVEVGFYCLTTKEGCSWRMIGSTAHVWSLNLPLKKSYSGHCSRITTLCFMLFLFLNRKGSTLTSWAPLTNRRKAHLWCTQYPCQKPF